MKNWKRCADLVKREASEFDQEIRFTNDKRRG